MEIEKPTVVKALRVFAWISLVASPILGLAIAAAESSAVPSSISDSIGAVAFAGAVLAGIVSSTGLFGFAAVIMKLYEIESHLSSSTPTPTASRGSGMLQL